MADYQDSDLLGDSGKVDTAPLDEDDDFFDVLKEVTPITEKWRAIGHALRLKLRELDSIAASHPHNAEECLSEMLSQWLRRNYNVKRFGEPSWQRLVEVVGDPAGGANPAVANQIAEKHRAKQTTGGGSGGITVPGKLDSGATMTAHSTLSTAEPITGGSPSDSASPSTTYQENTATDASAHLIIQGKGHAAGQQPIDIQWRTGTDTPESMYRGAAVSHGKMAYFNCANSTSVYCYNSQHQLWRKLPNCHSLDSALVMIDDKVTTVGGRQAMGGATNSLASLTGEEKDRKWVKIFPRMPTARYHLAAVCRGRNVIAAGGNYRGRRLSTVEILDIDLRQWSTAASLPHAMILASFTVCEDSLYLLGGTDQNGWTLSVLTSSITELLDQQQETANQLETANQPAVWHQAANTPYYDCTAVSVRGQLLAIGGRDKHLKHTSAVVAYDPTSDSWKDMGHMITPRYFALIALLPSNELIVAGGAKDMVTLSKVEIGTVV